MSCCMSVHWKFDCSVCKIKCCIAKCEHCFVQHAIFALKPVFAAQLNWMNCSQESFSRKCCFLQWHSATYLHCLSDFNQNVLVGRTWVRHVCPSHSSLIRSPCFHLRFSFGNFSLEILLKFLWVITVQKWPQFYWLVLCPWCQVLIRTSKSCLSCTQWK